MGQLAASMGGGVMDERDRLLNECQTLLQALAQHPYACSLLKKAKGFLEAAIGYKADRCK
ncbi:MAG: hypothetical protein ACM37W_26960 [Actinomycetota bacterium]